MKLIALIITLTVIFLSIETTKASDPIQTAPYVEINKYMGTWYEIARYENWFQEKCEAVRVKYELKNNYVKVLNECVITNNPQKTAKARGIAYIKDKITNAKLKVSFAPFFKYLGLFAGDYWIMELDSEYNYALIGTPDLKFLWIISRTPTLDGDILQELIDIAVYNGFNSDLIKITPTWKL